MVFSSSKDEDSISSFYMKLLLDRQTDRQTPEKHDLLIGGSTELETRKNSEYINLRQG